VDHVTALAIGLGAAIAGVVSGYLFRMSQRSERRSPDPVAQAAAPTEMVLRDGVLVDTTTQARALLDIGPHETLAWEEVRAALRPFFGPIPADPDSSQMILPAPDDPETRLEITSGGGRRHLSISAPPVGAGDRLRWRVGARELALLRQVMTRTPAPAWLSDDENRVIWSNAAYTDLCTQQGADPATPPFTLLPGDDLEDRVTRASIPTQEGTALSWYEIQSCRIPDGRLHFAQNIDAAIEAETAQRTFLQTLTKIFAHLPIALAVFDRKHRLVLFNPALIDLTRLSAEFLSGRPNLLTFFDMLREQHMMPEPKDYGSWREHLQDVINAASSDHYVETWNLPSGLTYRITGRPHPDAGIAFLIEDISAEISLTRGYRQEIEITQSVLETLEDAVVVFSQLGHLTFCNAAYRALWGDETEATISATDIAEATRSWQSSCHPSPIWGDLREFVLTLRDRAGWDAEIHTIAGERLFCRAEPLAGGATLVRFSPMPCGIVRQCRNVLQSHA